jgi:hypothetical protein
MCPKTTIAENNKIEMFKGDQRYKNTAYEPC